MRPTRGVPPLRLLSLNVNGLRDGAKRRTLFHCLQQASWDVIFLQETHHGSQEEAERWAREGAGPALPWRGESFWAHGSTASRGVAILLRTNALLANATLYSSCPLGRSLRVDLDLDGSPASLVCIYAPVLQGARLAFFRQLQAILPHTGKDILLAGDFNCIADPADQQGGAGAVGRLVGYGGGLQVVENSFQLQDVWRQLHPTAQDFTHVAHNGAGATSARIDRWLLPPALLPRAEVAYMVDGLPGDHRGVALHLQPASKLKRGSGCWRLPLHVLSDDDYVTLMRDTINRFLADHAVSAQYSRAMRWDDMKRCIRDVSTAYGFRAAAARKRQVNSLQTRLQIAWRQMLRRPNDPAAVSSYTSAQQALQHMHQRDSKAAALRAGLLWQQYGEQSTHWFHAQGKIRQQATTISHLVPHGETQPMALDTDAGRALGGKVLSDYYSAASPHGLFRAAATDATAQTELLATVDRKLSPQHAAACEGPKGDGTIEKEEALHTLQGMARGKSPGSDGLPYEFLQLFWDELGTELVQVWEEAFESGDGRSLPNSMRHGIITLLHKGRGLPREQAASYRPITLLNADVKLLSKILALRFGGPLHHTIDVTQTAFLPSRWIGDNVLAHLEEVDYCMNVDEPGCQLILDFDKAFDRLDRQWVIRCMQTLGFHAGALKWVQMLLTDTFASVAFNGWRTPPFAVESGTPQGSPLSPLLYVIGAHPLATHLRSLAARGIVSPITMPNGQPAPICHQHADDTSIHTRSLQDGLTCLNTSVALFSAASAAKVSLPKTKALLLGPAARDFPGGLHPSGIVCVKDGEPLIHLGIPLGRGVQQARDRMFDGILGKIRRHVGHWSAQQLSFLGRVHVARQVLASALYYHATFLRPSIACMTSLSTCIYGYVATGHPVWDPAASALHPRRLLCAMPWQQGGVQLPDLHSQIPALQAKIVARLFEPEHHPWKVFMRQWLHRDAHWYANHPAAILRDIDVWGYGQRLLFTQYDLSSAHLPVRVSGYFEAFKALHPFRRQPYDSMPTSSILREPLFFNSRIVGADNRPLEGQQWKPLASAGIRWVADLAAFISGTVQLGEQHLQNLAADASNSIPAAWSAAIAGPPRYCTTWLMTATGDKVIHIPDTAAGQQTVFRVHPSQQLERLHQHPPLQIANCTPVAVLLWDHRRPWRSADQGSTSRSQPSPYLLGSWETLSAVPDLWAVGAGQSVAEYVVSKGSLRLRSILLSRAMQSYQAGHGIKPYIWEEPTAATRGIDGVEARWEATIVERARSVQWQGITDTPAWMRPPQQRQLPRLRAANREPPAPQQPRRQRRPVVDDCLDVAATTTLRPTWAKVWSDIHLPQIPREHRVVAWKLMHAALPCPAFQCYIGRADNAACRRPNCGATFASLTHCFLQCATAQAAIRWLAATWARIDPAGGPPLQTAAVILAGDTRLWQPSQQGKELWTVLRLATLHALWVCDGSMPGVACNATAVACRVIYGVRASISQDWVRVVRDIRQQAGACATWFRGRDPQLQMADFKERWCLGDMLCSVEEFTQNRAANLRLHFSAQHPMPVP